MPIPGKTFIEGEVVTHADLNQAQSGLTFAEGELPGAALTDGTLSREKIVDDAVNNDKVLKNSLAPDRIETAPEDVNNNRGGVILVSDNTGDFQAVHTSGDISVTSAGLLTVKNAAINADKLATNAVTRDKIGVGEVSSYHMRTLVYDISNSFGDYAATVPNLGTFDPVAHVGLFITLLVGLKNNSNARLALNGGASYPLQTPSGDAVVAGNIAGGQVLSLVFTGSSWAVMSPLNPIVRTQLFNGSVSNDTIVIPTGATKIRVRLWGKGARGVLLSRNQSTGASSTIYSDAAYPTGVNLNRSEARGGGAGGYAEWYGLLSNAGLAVNDTLEVAFSASDSRLNLRVGGGATRVLLLRVLAGTSPTVQQPNTVGQVFVTPYQVGGLGAPTTELGTLPLAPNSVYSSANGSAGLNAEVDLLSSNANRLLFNGGGYNNGRANGGCFYVPDGVTPIAVPAGDQYCTIETEAT